MSFKKALSVFLYFAYATFLILFITFGSSSSSIVSDIVEKMLMVRDIEDVTVDVSSGREFLASRTYYPQYTAHGEFYGDGGLLFESLDPEYLSVGKNGSIYCNMKFEGDAFEGRVKVTSKYDDDFEKVFTYRFVKKSPSKFVVAYYIKGYDYVNSNKEAENLYTGVPVYVTSKLSDGDSSSNYNITGYTVVYDEEYFEKASDGTLIPIKPTPEGVQLTFSVVYESGKSATTAPFAIYEPDQEYSEIDEVKIINKDGEIGAALDNHTLNRNSTFALKLYNDGAAVITDYVLTCEESGMKQSKNGFVYFTSPGEKHLTITLPNGFEYKCVVNIKNIIKAPYIKNDPEVKETHVIKMLDTDVKKFTISYPSGVTYTHVKFEYDSSLIKVKSDDSGITITGKSNGTTELKVILDDGFTRVEDVYTVEVEENKETNAIILKNLSKFVAKVLGHMTLFIVLGFFAMNMIQHFDGIDKLWHILVIYVLTGLPAAIITEFVQLFIQGRSASFADIGIDMLGFLIGTVVFIIAYPILHIAALLDKN